MGDHGEVLDSPQSVMTFEVGGCWLAVRVVQIERVAIASRLWPVPLARPEHIGLLDTGQELIPVLRLDFEHQPQAKALGPTERLVAILQVRGEAVGLEVGRAGRVLDRYRPDEPPEQTPSQLLKIGALPVRSSDLRFWLVDADRLFASESPGATPNAANV